MPIRFEAKLFGNLALKKVHLRAPGCERGKLAALDLCSNDMKPVQLRVDQDGEELRGFWFPGCGAKQGRDAVTGFYGVGNDRLKRIGLKHGDRVKFNGLAIRQGDHSELRMVHGLTFKKRTASFIRSIKGEGR
jgi:hypothetical protein